MFRGKFVLTKWAFVFLMPILLGFQVAFSQTIEGKEIKSGVWEGQSVEYVSGQILFKPKLSDC